MAERAVAVVGVKARKLMVDKDAKLTGDTIDIVTMAI